MNITKKIMRITIGVLGMAILFLGLWACSNDDNNEIKKQENNLEILRKDLSQLNKNNTNFNTTYGNGKPINGHSIIQSDCVGVIAGGRLGAYFGPWGAGIGMIGGAALVSYADYVGQKDKSDKSVKAPKDYTPKKLSYVNFEDKYENIGIGHNVLLNQLILGERPENDFKFDKRISEYFNNYNFTYDENIATNVNNRLNDLYNDIKNNGIESTTNSFINNGSLLVKETIISFNSELLKCVYYEDCIVLIQNYKNYIDNSDIYNQEEKDELMAFLVVAKYSAHYWTSSE